MQRRTFISSGAALAAAACTGVGSKAGDLNISNGVAGDPSRLGFDAARLSELDEAMAASVAKGEVPGISYLVARHGQVAAFGAHGLAAPSRNLLVKWDTIFRIFSMTKPVTGIAMMILYERGKWQLTDPVTKFLPELAKLTVTTGVAADGTLITTPVKRPATMAELMSHTAGFGYGITADDPVDRIFMMRTVQQSADLAELAAKVADIPLKYQPGEGWAYSIAVDLQARIIEVITGKTFGAFLREEIFTPLKMPDTDFFVPPEKLGRFADLFAANPMTGHAGPLPPEYFSRVRNYADPIGIESGGGGLVSTLGDYGRFCQMLLNHGELEGVRLLKPETIAVMGRNQIPPDVTASNELIAQMGTTAFRFGPGVGFGLDFMVVEDPGPLGLPVGKGTLSWGGAAGTWFWIDPTNDLYVIGMIQRLGGSTKATDLPGESRRLTYAALISAAT